MLLTFTALTCCGVSVVGAGVAVVGCCDVAAIVWQLPRCCSIADVVVLLTTPRVLLRFRIFPLLLFTLLLCRCLYYVAMRVVGDVGCCVVGCVWLLCYLC